MGDQEETPRQEKGSQKEAGDHKPGMDEPTGPRETDRPYSLKRFGQEFASDVINVDSSLPGTLYDLFKMPGVVVTSYFSEPGRYMKPFRYTLFIGGFYVLLATGLLDMQQILEQAFDQIGTGNASNSGRSDLPEEVKAFLNKTQHLGILLTTQYLSASLVFITTPAYTLTSFLMFRASKSRFVQHAVLNLYAAGQIIIFSLMPLVAMIIGGGRTVTSDYIGYASTLFSLIYIIYVYRDYFKVRGFEGYSKCFLSILLGSLLYVVFLLVVEIVGAVIWQFAL